jgi:hypothetical protein
VRLRKVPRKTECKGEHSKNLINEKGEEVSILVDLVNTIDRLEPGFGILPVADSRMCCGMIQMQPGYRVFCGGSGFNKKGSGFIIKAQDLIYNSAYMTYRYEVN